MTINESRNKHFGPGGGTPPPPPNATHGGN